MRERVIFAPVFSVASFLFLHPLRAPADRPSINAKVSLSPERRKTMYSRISRGVTLSVKVTHCLRNSSPSGPCVLFFTLHTKYESEVTSAKQ